MNGNDTPRGNGFTLVEVVMALIVISVGLLALATSSGYILGQVQTSRLRTERAAAVQEAMEVVRSLPYTSIADSSAAYGHYGVSWRAEQVNFALTRVEFVSVGPSWRAGHGIVQDVPDTVRISVVRP